jgi:hypothetical protein
MIKQHRIKALQDIKANPTNVERTGIPVMYKGKKQEFDAYKIPLDCLIYNKYNGRISSSVKSFEKQYRELDPENSEDKSKIEKFLWESKIDRNQQTMSSLVEVGQQVHGIVTSDGVIIDGNRRASLLNRVWTERKEWEKKKHNVDDCQYFVAIILPDNAEKKEVLRLETTYQMGEDKKLDYNAIEKYLKCKDLKSEGFTEADIAKMMAEEESKIKEWIRIMKLMDEYLDLLGYKGIYTRLEKREGQFVDLNGYLANYENPNGSTKVSWSYDASDVADLKAISFDYIRAQYEGKEFRLLAKPSKKDSFFCNAKIWRDFRDRHFKFVENVEEKPVSQARKESPEGDLSTILKKRDDQWAETTRETFKKNLQKSESKLENINESNRPLELVQKAKDALESIDTAVDAFSSSKVSAALAEINLLISKYQKLIKKGANE